MKKIFTLLTFCAISFSGISQCTDLFFSEYIEGSSNNKALEIYNPTAAPVDLSNYTVKTYFNGSATTTTSITLTGTLNPGEVFVIAHASANATIIAQADMMVNGSIVNFNGDDAIELLNTTTIIDVIGTVGTDPGTSWTVSGDATGSNNHTMRRMSSVQAGTATWAGDGEDEWIIYPQDAIWYLGSHVMNTCGSTLSGSGSGTGVCLGSSSAFSASGTSGSAPYMYGWDFGDGSTPATVQNPTYTFAAAGTYNVTFYIYDAMFNVYAETFSFTIYPVSDATITAAGPYCSSDCGDTLTAAEAGGTWSGTGITNATAGSFDACVAGAGNHTITYTITGVCGDADSIGITVIQQEDVVINTPDTTFCNDSFGIFLNADSGGAWSGQYVADSGNGDGFFSSAVIPPGIYYAVYTIGGMCGDADSIALTIGQYPIASFTYVVNGGQVILTNTSMDASDYSWEIDEDGEITTSQLEDFTYNYTDPANDITVCLTATNGFGCSMTDCETITGNGIEDNELLRTALYPNPTEGILIIDQLPASEPVQIRIADISGRILFSKEINATVKTQVDLSELMTGAYFVTISTETLIVTRKINVIR